MKPDGVATAVLEPMEALESNEVNEAGPPVSGEEPSQAASPLEETTGPPQIELVQGEAPPKASPTKTPADPKAKTAGKAGTKTKPGTTGPAKTAAGSRPGSAQSRLTNGTPKTNGVAKSEGVAKTNGVAKKTASSTADKKTAAPAKKPAGSTNAAPAKTAPSPWRRSRQRPLAPPAPQGPRRPPPPRPQPPNPARPRPLLRSQQVTTQTVLLYCTEGLVFDVLLFYWISMLYCSYLFFIIIGTC